jgi:hypothetical protein
VSTRRIKSASCSLAQPDNPEYGANYREQGIFQVNLFYPLGIGTGAAAVRAMAIRAQFPRALSLTASGVTVTINRTTWIGQARPDEPRLMVPCKVFWHANLF